jgi:hypothetical protein
MTSVARTFYTVETYWWYYPGHHQDPYWLIAESGPGGNTIEDAHKRVKEDIKRFVKNKTDLSKIKIRIKKTVTIESVEEELIGSDFTALMLKTA